MLYGIINDVETLLLALVL